MADMFCWYELATSDPQAAADFYRDVAGWSSTPVPMGDMTYLIQQAADRRVAGIMPAMPGGPGPMWFGYIGVDDVDASAAKVTALGGKVLRAPDDIEGVGRFAPCADPQGAMFMLFTGAGGPAPKMPFEMGTAGCWGWNELIVRTLAPAVDFYAALFGWAKDEAVDMGPMGIYQLFSAGARGGAYGDAIGGMMAFDDMPVGWTYYICVGDIDAAAARVKAGGGAVINGPMEVPGGAWVLNAVDPQGAGFALLGHKA